MLHSDKKGKQKNMPWCWDWRRKKGRNQRRKEWWKPITQQDMPNPTITNLYNTKMELSIIITIRENGMPRESFMFLREIGHPAPQA